jgi:hypothetical protein
MAWTGTRPSAFARTIERTLTQRQKDIATYTLNQLITSSPVQDGAYRGNHRVTVNGITSFFDPTQTSEQAALSAGLGVIGGISQAFGEVVIQNNAPYGQRLEAGWSQQGSGGNYYAIAFNSAVERFR